MFQITSEEYHSSHRSLIRQEISLENQRSNTNSIINENSRFALERRYVGTPRWMAPEMMDSRVSIGPSADVYSLGVVMWEVWVRRKPWSEFSDKQDIFNAVRDEKRTLSTLWKKRENVPDGYENLMRKCFEYKANNRPLIDMIRVDLQHLVERAARIDRGGVLDVMFEEEEKISGVDGTTAVGIEMTSQSHTETITKNKL